ncbi:MAG: hypothetical protein B7Y39_17020 [Bdellovibrio sp. 28-41-41]|nr:MAG: hypothetical protein B7Y39_17020 [Bdellovibrio sp. 28-41-41]
MFKKILIVGILSISLTNCMSVLKGEHVRPEETSQRFCADFEIEKLEQSFFSDSKIKKNRFNFQNYREYGYFKRNGLENCGTSDRKYLVSFFAKETESRSFLDYLWLTSSIITASLIPYKEDKVTSVRVTNRNTGLEIGNAQISYSDWISAPYIIWKLLNLYNIDSVELDATKKASEIITSDLIKK